SLLQTSSYVSDIDLIISSKAIIIVKKNVVGIAHIEGSRGVSEKSANRPNRPSHLHMKFPRAEACHHIIDDVMSAALWSVGTLWNGWKSLGIRESGNRLEQHQRSYPLLAWPVTVK
ncbi:hypothetical protein ACO22_03182, partial [Paracoccidioides brasiliensis]